MNKRLTVKQIKFVNELVREDGSITPTEAARRAGYSVDRARTTASELLNVQRNPEVVRYFDELKKEMQHKFQSIRKKEMQWECFLRPSHQRLIPLV